jgi:hypothetical protein
LGVDVLRVEGEVLTPTLVQHLVQIKGHAEAPEILWAGGDRLVGALPLRSPQSTRRGFMRRSFRITHTNI